MRFSSSCIANHTKLINLIYHTCKRVCRLLGTVHPTHIFTPTPTLEMLDSHLQISCQCSNNQVHRLSLSETCFEPSSINSNRCPWAAGHVFTTYNRQASKLLPAPRRCRWNGSNGLRYDSFLKSADPKELRHFTCHHMSFKP